VERIRAHFLDRDRLGDATLVWRIALGRPHGLIFPRAKDRLGWRKFD
jgi:hypothetical protein